MLASRFPQDSEDAPPRLIRAQDLEKTEEERRKETAEHGP